jgi:hypothetical protein
MSMSQEEIEALMNDTSIEDVQEEATAESIAEEISEDLLQIEDLPIDDVDTEGSDDINDILAGIDGIVDDEEPTEVDDGNFEDILATIDDISVDEIDDTSSDPEADQKAAPDKYPLPVENENKVVNQLNQVAADSEQKASQIFDVLSFILDENNEIQSYNNQMAEFINGQIELLESLSTKFPNISVFSKHMEEAQALVETSKQLSLKVDGENNKVFEAMELMQYHDINRQKIERVMAVIRKLSSYLNGIFEDESNGPEIQVAKHIAGDDHDDVVDAEDIESLINEFSK